MNTILKSRLITYATSENQTSVSAAELKGAYDEFSEQLTTIIDSNNSYAQAYRLLSSLEACLWAAVEEMTSSIGSGKKRAIA